MRLPFRRSVCLLAFASCAAPLDLGADYDHASGLVLPMQSGSLTRVKISESSGELHAVYEGVVREDSIEVQLSIFRSPGSDLVASSALYPFSIAVGPRHQQGKQLRARFASRLAEVQEPPHPSRVFTTSIGSPLGALLGKHWVGESSSFLFVPTTAEDSDLYMHRFGMFASGRWTLELLARTALAIDSEPCEEAMRELLRTIGRAD